MSASTMPTRKLGSSGLEVGAIGYGLMMMTWKDGDDTPDDQAFEAMKASVDAGSTFWNSGTFYGNPDPLANIKLIRRFFDKYPDYADKVVLSVKGGLQMDISDEATLRADIQKAVDILSPAKKIDLFEVARMSKPVEDVMPLLLKFQKEGLFTHISLSETKASTLRKAAAIGPVVAVEVECSLLSIEPELLEVIKACEELDIALVGYSPLAYGALAADWKSHDDIPEGHMARQRPKMSRENFATNRKLVDAVKALAADKGVTPAQLAIGWCLRLSSKVIPIPGSSKRERTLENAAAAEVKLSDEEFARLDAILAEFPVQGDRYGPNVQHLNWQ